MQHGKQTSIGMDARYEVNERESVDSGGGGKMHNRRRIESHRKPYERPSMFGRFCHAVKDMLKPALVADALAKLTSTTDRDIDKDSEHAKSLPELSNVLVQDQNDEFVEVDGYTAVFDSRVLEEEIKASRMQPQRASFTSKEHAPPHHKDQFKSASTERYVPDHVDFALRTRTNGRNVTGSFSMNIAASGISADNAQQINIKARENKQLEYSTCGVKGKDDMQHEDTRLLASERLNTSRNINTMITMPAFNMSTFCESVEKTRSDVSALNRTYAESSYYAGRTTFGGASTMYKSNRGSPSYGGASVSSPYRMRMAVEQRVKAASSGTRDVAVSSVTARRMLDAINKINEGVDMSVVRHSNKSCNSSVVLNSPLSFTPSVSIYRRNSTTCSEDHSSLNVSSTNRPHPPVKAHITPIVNRPIERYQSLKIGSERKSSLMEFTETGSDNINLHQQGPVAVQEHSTKSAMDTFGHSVTPSQSTGGKAKKAPKHYSFKGDESVMEPDPALSSVQPFAININPVSFGIGSAQSLPRSVKECDKQFEFSLPKHLQHVDVDSRAPKVDAGISSSTSYFFSPPMKVNYKNSYVKRDGSTQMNLTAKSLSSQTSTASSCYSSTHTSAKDQNYSIKPLSELFKKSTDLWTCSVCMISNKNDQLFCAACNEPKVLRSTVVPSATPTSVLTQGDNVPLAELFKKSADIWQCNICFVDNKRNAHTCVACNTPQLGAAAKSTTTENQSIQMAAAGGFTFKVNSGVKAGGLSGANDGGQQSQNVNCSNNKGFAGFNLPKMVSETSASTFVICTQSSDSIISGPISMKAASPCSGTGVFCSGDNEKLNESLRRPPLRSAAEQSPNDMKSAASALSFTGDTSISQSIVLSKAGIAVRTASSADSNDQAGVSETRVNAALLPLPTNKPLSELFEKPRDTWVCTECFVHNKNDRDVCMACESVKSINACARNASSVKPVQEPGQQRLTSGILAPLGVVNTGASVATLEQPNRLDICATSSVLSTAPLKFTFGMNNVTSPISETHVGNIRYDVAANDLTARANIPCTIASIANNSSVQTTVESPPDKHSMQSSGAIAPAEDCVSVPTFGILPTSTAKFGAASSTNFPGFKLNIPTNDGFKSVRDPVVTSSNIIFGSRPVNFNTTTTTTSPFNLDGSRQTTSVFGAAAAVGSASETLTEASSAKPLFTSFLPFTSTTTSVFNTASSMFSQSVPVLGAQSTSSSALFKFGSQPLVSTAAPPAFGSVTSTALASMTSFYPSTSQGILPTYGSANSFASVSVAPATDVGQFGVSPNVSRELAPAFSGQQSGFQFGSSSVSGQTVNASKQAFGFDGGFKTAGSQGTPSLFSFGAASPFQQMATDGSAGSCSTSGNLGKRSNDMANQGEANPAKRSSTFMFNSSQCDSSGTFVPQSPFVMGQPITSSAWKPAVAPGPFSTSTPATFNFSAFNHQGNSTTTASASVFQFGAAAGNQVSTSNQFGAPAFNSGTSAANRVIKKGIRRTAVGKRLG